VLHRLVKTAAALALVFALLPAAARPATAADAEWQASAVSRRQAAAQEPSWLAWLKSLLPADPPPAGDPQGATEEGDDGQDAGPSQDPDG
jgi:hypothetical protein